MMRYLKLFSEGHTQPAISSSHGAHLNFFSFTKVCHIFL